MQLQKKAEKRCSSVLRRADVHGFLCWYCDANLIQNGAERVFAGINPAGDSKDNAKDLKEGTREKPYTIPGWNIWLDGEQHDYQKAVRRLFEAMEGPCWGQALRSTACFNVFPFRAPKWKKLVSHYKLWNPLAKWFEEVLVQIKQKKGRSSLI